LWLVTKINFLAKAKLSLTITASNIHSTLFIKEKRMLVSSSTLDKLGIDNSSKRNELWHLLFSVVALSELASLSVSASIDLLAF